MGRRGLDNGREAPASGAPSAMELLWGGPVPTRRGPKPALRVEDVVTAAIEIADADGLEAVSMSRVAERLGFTTMALYRYVASKDDLLMLMLNDAVGPPPAELAPATARGWRDGLGAWSRGMYDRVLEHPWINQVRADGPPTLPNQLLWMDRGVAPLEGTRLNGQEKLSTILTLSVYAMSAAFLTTSVSRAATAPRPDDAGTQASLADYGQILAHLLDSERFPALHAIAVSGEIEPSAPPSHVADELHAEFNFGLDRILDGLEVLLASRGTGPTSKG